MNFTKSRPYLALGLLTILLTLGFWLFFYLHLSPKLGFSVSSLETVFANYDGPNYIIVSKCWYQRDCILKNFSLPQPAEYYPAHFPGYPLLIKYFSLFTTSTKAMIFATLIGSVFLTLATFESLKLFLSAKTSFYLSLVSLFLPARLLVLRIVGAPETWFIALTLTSIIYFKNKKLLPAAIFAALAQAFKSPGIILFLAYGVLFFLDLVRNRKVNFNYFYFLLIPLTVLAIFYFYYLQTGDFLAYFHSGDNFHLYPLPYQIFISNHFWINTIWLEDIIFILILAFIGVQLLFKNYAWDIVFIYPFLFALVSIFVAHRDLSRYLSPLFPYLFLAFSSHLDSKIFRTAFYLIIPAVILYASNFIIGNTSPIADWFPYL